MIPLMTPARSIALVLLLGAPVFAADPVAGDGETFFAEKIRPILQDNCYKCHSHSAEKIKGGLVLDSRDAVLSGGDTGPAIVPGDPEKSLLIEAVGYKDQDLQMPPKNKKLADEQIALLTEWVKRGAPWSKAVEQKLGDRKMAIRPKGKITDEDRKWWAFQASEGAGGSGGG